MNEMGFLLDEHIPIIIQERLKQMEPKVRVYAIGDGIAPSKGTPDPDILSWIAAHIACWLPTTVPQCLYISVRIWVEASTFPASCNFPGE